MAQEGVEAALIDGHVLLQSVAMTQTLRSPSCIPRTGDCNQAAEPTATITSMTNPIDDLLSCIETATMDRCAALAPDVIGRHRAQLAHGRARRRGCRSRLRRWWPSRATSRT